MKIKYLKDASVDSGGKAFGLAMLIKFGIPVPAGFVINDTLNLDFNDENKKILEQFLNSLDSAKKLAVRSSACAEDGVDKSYAGIFDTELNVDNDLLSVINAIKQVNKSASTDIVTSYSDNDRQVMNIVIQEMVGPKIAGVVFTDAIDINGDDVVLFECVEGLADKLVNGEANPVQVIAKIENNEINASNLRIEGPLFDLTLLKNIIPLVNKIKSKSEKSLDMEWCIDEFGNTYFVQARPITSSVFINRKEENSIVIASRGYAEGETYIINENVPFEKLYEDIANFEEGSILVAGITSTMFMPAIKKAKGIITEEGSSLSHAAIVSRELGIPCIAGYKDARKKFPTGTKIVLDALNGRIVTDNVEKLIDNPKGFEFGELFCFDNYCSVDFGEFRVFFETTYDGLVAHMSSGSASPQNLMILEKYARKVFKESPHLYFNDKYIYYYEMERLKKLPFYFKIYQEMMEIVESKDSKKLDDFYDKCLKLLEELVKYKETTKSAREKIIIGEICFLIHLFLDVLLPLGYALRQCYLDLLPQLEKYNLSFNDVLSNKKLSINDSEITKTQSFLDDLSIKRNTIYEKICSIGATDPNYMYSRIENIYEVCSDFTGVKFGELLLNRFYDTISEEDLYNIKLIMRKYFI